MQVISMVSGLKLVLPSRHSTHFSAQNFQSGALRPSVFVAIFTCNLQMCFLPQRYAIFARRFPHWPPHPPLYGAYFLTILEHKTIENTTFQASPIIPLHTSVLLSHVFWQKACCNFRSNFSTINVCRHKCTTAKLLIVQDRAGCITASNCTWLTEATDQQRSRSVFHGKDLSQSAWKRSEGFAEANIIWGSRKD